MKSTPNYKKATIYQIWQEGYQPKLMQSDGMMINNYLVGILDEGQGWKSTSFDTDSSNLSEKELEQYP